MADWLWFWLIVIVGVALLGYAWCTRGWYRVRAIVFLVALYLSAPVINIVIKALGLEIKVEQDGWGGAVVMIAVISLALLERQAQSGSHSREILELLIAHQKNGQPIELIARKLGVTTDALMGIWMEFLQSQSDE